MKLIACTACHLQYDVTYTDDPFVSCICGEAVSTAVHDAIDAKILRCGSCGAAVPDDAKRCDYCESVIVRDVEKLSLVCPACYARNAETGRFCASCGVRFQPQAFFGGDYPELSCPACEGDLVPQNVGGIVVRECDRCHGLWVPGDHLDDLVKRMIAARREQGPLVADGSHRKTAFQGEIVYRKCPECHKSMQRKNFARKSGIIVDWCGHHGNWLDADELEGIAAFVLAGKLVNEAADAAMQSWQQPADTKRMEAIYQAEKLMAIDRMHAGTQRDRDQSDINALTSREFSLVGLLRWLFQ